MTILYSSQPTSRANTKAAQQQYLNDHVADEGYYFGSSEGGDWGLWPINDNDID